MSTIDISELKSGLPWYDNSDESIDISDEIQHYGTPRHSGRYPWGSGDNPYQHASYFMSKYTELKKQGLKESEIAAKLNMSMDEMRARRTNSINEMYESDRRQVIKMKEKGMSNVAIGKLMGKSEGTIRNMLKDHEDRKANKVQNLAEVLKASVDEKGFIDIGKGVAETLHVNESNMKAAIALLKDQGYVYDNKVFVQQATNADQFTTLKVLAKPGTDHKEIVANRFDIDSVVPYYGERDENGDYQYYKFKPPVSIDGDRVFVRYGDEGGKERDGLIQLRRGVEDISLGNDLYSQVRIGVNGTNYMKGMAVYSDDIPEGYDIVYNTNKPKGSPLFDGPKDELVFKPMKTIDILDENGNKIGKEINKDNPFGSSIKDMQHTWKDENGVEHQSVINKIREEGDWDDWSRTLPTQFLAKQSATLIKKQLDTTYADKLDEYSEIMSLTNPTIKKAFLKDFADGLDKSAVDLKTRALPGQSVQVILPDPNVKEGEIYAPNYENGSYVALIRYPHAGTFEIPICKVNNNVKSAKKMLTDENGPALDAVVINAKTANQLSGADFDGDTVTVIPTHGANGVKITSKPYLEDMKDFDHTELYKKYDGMKVISKENMQKQMGVVSNLITDMTIQGADDHELARAVKHSMVIIDSYKHELDYRSSYTENGIEELQKKYQPKEDGKFGGASTLFSRAKSQERVNKREEGQLVIDPETGKKTRQYFDPETGEKLYTEKGTTTLKLSASAKKKVKAIKDDPDMDGETKQRKLREIYADEGVPELVQTISTKMAEAKDARTLSSGTLKENLYADYANNLKELANKSRLEYLKLDDVKRNPQAAKDYAPEVESLKAKVDTALMNAPKERQAQLLANKRAQKEIERNPELKEDTKELKKVKTMLLQKARIEVGAEGKKSRISLTDSEWEAIQNNAVSANLLNQIINHTDSAKLKERAMPNNNSLALSTAKQNRIKAYAKSGYTIAEIADALGVSQSAVIKYMKG